MIPQLRRLYFRSTAAAVFFLALCPWCLPIRGTASSSFLFPGAMAMVPVCEEGRHHGRGVCSSGVPLPQSHSFLAPWPWCLSAERETAVAVFFFWGIVAVVSGTRVYYFLASQARLTWAASIHWFERPCLYEFRSCCDVTKIFMDIIWKIWSRVFERNHNTNVSIGGVVWLSCTLNSSKYNWLISFYHYRERVWQSRLGLFICRIVGFPIVRDKC